MSLTETYSGFKTTYQNAKDLVNAEIERILVVPTSKQIGIAGLVFDAILEENIDLKSTVTNNYVEDGSQISDHIILEPITVSISGEVSELYFKNVFSTPNAINRRIAQIQSTIGEYLPPRTQSQLSKIAGLILDAQNAINAIDRAIDKGEQLFNIFNKDESKSRQQTAYDFLYSCWKTKQVFDVQTKNQVFKNMTITSLSQRNENDSYTTFTLSFQEIRIASTKLVDVKRFAKKPSGNAKAQTEKKSDKGTVSGQRVGDTKKRSLFATIVR